MTSRAVNRPSRMPVTALVTALVLQAAVVARPGLVWVLGGRDGSTVLDSAELLLHPGTYTSPDTGAGVRLARWRLHS